MELNGKAPLGSTLLSDPEITLDTANEQVNITVSYVPFRDIVPPAGATHALLMATASGLNFDAGKQMAKTSGSAYFPVASTNTESPQIILDYDADFGSHLAVGIGVHFFQDVNGSYYPLKNGAYNAVQVAKVFEV